MEDKVEHAHRIIQRVVTSRGVCASTDRYKNQCWTRDFCLAIYPIIKNYKYMFSPVSPVEAHFVKLCELQDVTGKIPILYLGDEKIFLRERINKSIRQGKISFMLERYLADELENLTPHTRDAEVLFVIAAGHFLKTCENPNTQDLLRATIHSALNYTEHRLQQGLIVGADWRDTRVDLDQKAVLTNACLLYQAYVTMGMAEKACVVKDIIQSRFWNGTYFNDYEGCSHFDILGNALAVLYDIAHESQRDTIFESALKTSTPYGMAMMETFLPALNEKETLLMTTDKAVIWPWVSGFMLQAFIEKGGPRWTLAARVEFQKWCKLEGHFEWYSISTGEGCGSAEQTWSATMFVTIYRLLFPK